MLFCHECQRPYPRKIESWDCPLCGREISSNDGIPLFAPSLSLSCGGFPDDAHAELMCLERKYFWFVYRNRLIEWGMNSFWGSAEHLLDLGCGTGFFLEFISGKYPTLSFSGGEAYVSALQAARSRVTYGNFYQMSAEQLPFFEEFDVIGAFDVLEHLDDDRKALQEIHRSLRPGGGVILTVPQHSSLWSETDEIACHKRRYSRHRLTNALRGAGFRLLFISSFMTLLLPVMIMARCSRHFFGKKGADPRSELKIANGLNSLFLNICRFEMEIIKKKISLPAGGSLFAVGLKETVKDFT